MRPWGIVRRPLPQSRPLPLAHAGPRADASEAPKESRKKGAGMRQPCFQADVRIKGAKYRFALQDGTWDFS